MCPDIGLFFLFYQLQRHRADEFVKIIRHIWPEERHHPRLITAQMIITRTNNIANVVSVEAGYDCVGTARAQEILDPQRQLAAEITRRGNPDRVVETEHLDEAGSC